jgi:hypothetical protein
MHLERAAQDVVRYLPNKVCFFSEVVWGHEDFLCHTCTDRGLLSKPCGVASP